MTLTIKQKRLLSCDSDYTNKEKLITVSVTGYESCFISLVREILTYTRFCFIGILCCSIQDA